MRKAMTQESLDKDIDEMQWKIAGLTSCCGGTITTEWIHNCVEGEYCRSYPWWVCSKCRKLLSDKFPFELTGLTGLTGIHKED